MAGLVYMSESWYGCSCKAVWCEVLLAGICEAVFKMDIVGLGHESNMLD